jgi:methyltransferase family protein
MARTAQRSWLGIRMRLPFGTAPRLASRWAGWPHRAAAGDNKRRPAVNVPRQQRLEHFNTHIYGHVEGWLGDRMWQIVDVIGTILDANDVRGNIAEFGIHHGLFLFLLNALRHDDEICLAIDVFDEQRLNVDGSGRGSLAAFCSHLETLMAAQRHAFKIVQRDTTSFSISGAVGLFGDKGVKFFSIDAGHSVQHSFNDLCLAQEVLVPGGIVALDDYMSPHWPGVTEGFYRFTGAANRRLKPLFYFQNKLFLTTVSEHGAYSQQFRTAIEAISADEVRNGRWKEVEIAGSYCLSFQ